MMPNIPNIPYSWAAVITLVILLGLSGLALKNQIEANGTLKSEVSQRDASIKRLSDQAIALQQEAKRLDTINQVRDDAHRASEQREARAKNLIRVAVSRDTEFARCSRINWPPELVDRLRNPSASGDGGDQAVPASAPDPRVSATYYPERNHY